jgi:hypothetical protein
MVFCVCPLGFILAGKNRLFTPMLPHGNGFRNCLAYVPSSDMVMSGNDKTVARPTLEYCPNNENGRKPSGNRAIGNTKSATTSTLKNHDIIYQ